MNFSMRASNEHLTIIFNVLVVFGFLLVTSKKFNKALICLRLSETMT